MSALTLAELTYEQAQKALEQQERQVNELRQRTGTLLGAAALAASFFGAAALGRDGVGVPIVLAGIALAVTVLSGLYVVANTALRIFLQEMGAAYDEERGLTPYNGTRDFKSVREFFGERCCYCDADLATGRPAQDHLVPMNKTSLGLHAWGNVVPACQDCNASKHGGEWHA